MKLDTRNTTQRKTTHEDLAFGNIIQVEKRQTRKEAIVGSVE